MTSEEIQEIYFVECEESLAAAEAGLAACRDGSQDADTVNAIFRAVHSIKGGAGAFGYGPLQAYTHTFETLLSDVRDGLLPVSEPLVALLLRALDTLTDHVGAARGNSAAPDDIGLIAEMTAAQAAVHAQAVHAQAVHAQAVHAQAAGSTVEPLDPVRPDPVGKAAPVATASPGDEPADPGSAFDLDALLDDIVGDFVPEAAVEPATPAPWHVHLRPHAGAMANGGEPLLLLRELEALGGECIVCDISHIPPLDALDLRQGYLGWTFRMDDSVAGAAVMDIFDFVGKDCSVVFGEGVAIPALQANAVGHPAPARQAPPAAVTIAPTIAVPAAGDPPATPLADPAPRDGKPAAAQSAPGPASPAQTAPAQATQAQSTQAQSTQAQSIRIDLPKLDRLIDSVGELVIAQAMLAQRLATEGSAASEELAMLDGLTREIQESAMSIRAQPIGSVFSRVPRILRELASSTGKHVRLEVSGEATELDKTVIERLGEPLTHLIRNAVDHGIEAAADRIATGKPAEGTLSLSAEHRSGRILIRIADDGRGIDRERVFAKAVEKGIVAADAQLSREEIDALIFAPGFSTAAVVTSVSGRGVGMDVVRQNVKDLGGRITIDSETGKGTSFTLTLPLTLAISDGMIVTVGNQTLVVPLAHIMESLRPEPGAVQGLGTNRQMLNVRGKFIPVLPVCAEFGAPSCLDNPERGVLIVVDTEVAGQAALLVDSICDQRQFVIKSLETHYRAVDGVAGATILGDGRVALILDVDGLVAHGLADDRRAA